MTRYHAWFELQRSVIDNGAAVAKIVLEGPDQSPFATWPIGHRDLEASCEGMLESLREALPKGRHQCRLVAFDAGGAQLSALPIVVAGASDAATEASQGRINNERSNALFLANAEKQIATTMKVVEQAAEVIAAQNEAILNLKRDRERNAEAIDERLQRAAERNAREQRLNLLLEKLAPMIEMGISVCGAYLGEWFEKRENAARIAKSAAVAEKPTAAAVPALELSGERRTEAPSLQPASASPTLCCAETSRGESPGLGCDPGDGGSPAARGGNAGRAKNSERATATRTSARKRRER